MKLSEIEKKVKALNYPCHGLLDANRLWLLKPNAARTPSKLSNVLQMLEGLPAGTYYINCSSGQGKRGAHYDYEVDTREAIEDFPKIAFPLSQAAPEIASNAEKMGRLEAENEYLRMQLASLETQLDEITADLLEDANDLSEAAPLPQTLQEKVLENLLPVIPPLADKLVSLLEKWLTKPAAISETHFPPQMPQAMADQIAEMVKAKIYAEAHAENNSNQPQDEFGN